MDRDKNGRFCKAQKEEKTIRGWKGFEPGLVCRGMQYKEGEVFEAPEAVPCGRSIHFCHKHPLDVFSYYAPGSEKGVSEYAEVEALGDVNTQDDKSATNKLKIVGKLSLAGLCKAAIDLTFSRAKWTKKKTATGSYGAASATGYNGAASATGSYGAASATGDQGAASAIGEESVACAFGVNGQAKASIGSFIVVAEWKRDEKCEWHRVSVKSIQVDGEKIKADTWYCLENGEFSEVK